jgi:hypothetical protein
MVVPERANGVSKGDCPLADTNRVVVKLQVVSGLREPAKAAGNLADILVADGHVDHEVVDGVVVDVRHRDPVDLQESSRGEPAEPLVAVD